MKKKMIPLRQNLHGSMRPLPEPIQFFVLGAMSILWEVPERGRVKTGETGKRIGHERSDFVSDGQPDAFRSGRTHQWLSSDLTVDNFSAHNP